MTVGRCKKPLWWGHGGPAGHCDEPAYGPGIPGKYVVHEWEGSRLASLDRGGHLTMACPKHGGPEAPE